VYMAAWAWAWACIGGDEFSGRGGRGRPTGQHMRCDEQRSSRTDMQEGVITRLQYEATITFCFSYQYQRGEVTRATGDGDGKLPNSVLLLALLRAQTLLLLCR